MLETYVRHSAAILPQSGTAPQGIRNIRSLRAAIVAHRKTYVPALSVSPATCQCPRMLETYVCHSAAILPQSGTAQQAIKNIRSPDRPTHQQRQPPRATPKTFVPSHPAGLPQSRHNTSQSPETSVLQSHSPATSTCANNPRTTPSQMLKTYVLTIGRDAAPCRHFPEIGHVSPAQNRAASTQSSQYSASSSRQPGSPGSTPRPQAAQKKTGSGGFSSGQPTR